jgi:hypothetical protein
MPDKFGIAEAAKRGIKLGAIDHRIVLENEHVRIWEINLDSGEIIDFHIHYHPYVVISLGGGENEIETIFGDRVKTVEELGSTVFINEMRAVRRLTNRAKIRYLSRLIELKNVRWTTEAIS